MIRLRSRFMGEKSLVEGFILNSICVRFHGLSRVDQSKHTACISPSTFKLSSGPLWADYIERIQSVAENDTSLTLIRKRF